MKNKKYNHLTKVCKECLIPIGMNTRSGLCKKHRVQEWLNNNRERSNEIKRRYVKKHPNDRYDSLLKYKKNNRQRVNAWAVLEYHVKNGDIEKPLYCEKCSINLTAHAHHPDISKPLNVIWVCNPCHKKAHGYNNQLQYAA